MMIQFSSLKAMTFSVFTVKKKKKILYFPRPKEKKKGTILTSNLELLIPL